MRIRRWQNTQQHCCVGILILFFVVLGSISPQLTMILSYYNSLQNTGVEVNTVGKTAK